MNHYKEIITVEPDKRSGQPCIRGMRITVYDIFEYLASGMTVTEVLDDFPELTETDIRACFAYAADKEKSQMVVYANETSIRPEPIGPTMVNPKNKETLSSPPVGSVSNRTGAECPINSKLYYSNAASGSVP